MTTDRTLEDLAAKFRCFAVHQAPKAPLYVRLAAAIAEDSEILGLASHARAGQPVPNLLFAAVQDRLLDDPNQPLAAHYPEIGGGRPDTDPWPPFRAFCLAHADTIIPILKTRIVQTNEVGRCALLLPALALAWRHGGKHPLALIEFGTSAGLNLLLDRYSYDYGDGIVRGDAQSSVRLHCERRGPAAAPLPDSVPPIRWRLGLDLNPLDVTRAEDARWLRALVWPGMPRRIAQLEAAIALATVDPPPLRRGDGIALLRDALTEAPAGATACIIHCHTLNQLTKPVQNLFETTLQALGVMRPIVRIGLEHEAASHALLTLHSYGAGGVKNQVLAHADPHGGWLEWLDQ